MLTPLAILILAITLLLFALDLIADRLNLSKLNDPPPQEFGNRVDPDRYRKILAYQRESMAFGTIQSTLTLSAFLIFWFAGGFRWVDHWAVRVTERMDAGEIITGLLFFGVIFALQGLLSLPFQLYSTFRIEQKHGFNRTDARTFWTDRAKGLVIGVLLGAPILATLIALFGLAEKVGPSAYVAAWGALSAFQILLSLVGPALILPWFYQLKPLEAGPLREKIEAYARSQNFTIADISVMNASKRSAKTNAFFAGAGRFRRLVLFDTLVERHTPEELLAVVAHEAGHFRLGHVRRGLIFSLITSAGLFFLLSISITNWWLAEAFGMDRVTLHGGMLFFGWLFQPVTRVIGLISLARSRKHEFEADDFALQTTGDGKPLAQALMGLALENLSHLTPHRLKVFLEHTHPPVAERVRKLQSHAPA